MAIEHTFKYLRNTSKGVEERIETRPLTAKQSIKFQCLDCSGGFSADVRNCHLKTCPLWIHRPYAK